MTFPILKNRKLAAKSAGYLKDLAFLKFGMGLLYSAIDDLVKDETIFIKTNKDNKNHKKNTQIKRRIEAFIFEGSKIFKRVNKDDLMKTDKTARLILFSMVKVSESNTTLNLELLAIYSFFLRFKEKRVKKLDCDFEYFSNSKRLFDLAALICEVDIDDDMKEYHLAAKLVKAY